MRRPNEKKLFGPYEKFVRQLKKTVKDAFLPLMVAGFDELNVIQVKRKTEVMYAKLERFDREAYMELVEHAWEWAMDLVEEDEKLNAETFVSSYLNGYDPITQYVFTREVDRKRMRLNEAIMTAKEYQDHGMLETAVKKAMNLWFTQSKQYAIDLTLTTLETAYSKAGEEWWMWNTIMDGRECVICGERNMRVYPKSEYPPREHYGCRCYPTPVKKP